MRKHHKRWVALVGAAAIASSGWVGLSGTVSAGERDTRTLTWPENGQEVSYSLDGYEIGYLPAGLERHGYQASSKTDRMGNRQSQLSWMHGPDQLLGRVSVVRSDRVQHLDDLRETRYGHLPERTLEHLGSGEALRNEAYLSPETGDLFWMEEPGVAVGVYLQPDRWSSGELVRMAESLTEEETGEPVEGPTVEEPTGETGAEPTEEPVEAPAQEGGGAQEPTGTPGEDESPEVAVAGAVPAGTAPIGRPETPEGPEPSGPSEDPDHSDDSADQGEDTAQEAPATEEPSAEEEAEQEPAETGTATESEQSDEARVRQAKECVVDRFVDSEAGESTLDRTEMTPADAEFVERVLGTVGLGDGELDRLVATLWYYADEDAKRGAVDDCSQELDLERAEVEAILDQLGSLIAEIVWAQNEDAEATHDANVSRTLEQGDSALDVEPIGAEEWEELLGSLPWSLPNSTS